MLWVFEGEADEEFQVGFYVPDEDIMYLEGELQSCHAKLSQPGANSHDPTQISGMPPLQTLTQ